MCNRLRLTPLLLLKEEVVEDDDEAEEELEEEESEEESFIANRSNRSQIVLTILPKTGSISFERSCNASTSPLCGENAFNKRQAR